MKHQLLKLAYIRKRDRKSLLFVISILLFSSFSDEIYLAAKQNRIDIKNKKERTVVSPKKEQLSHELTDQVIASTRDFDEVLPSKDGISIRSRGDHKYAVKAPSIKDKSTEPKAIPDRISIVEMLPSKPIMDLSMIEIDPNAPNIDDLLALGIPKKVAFTWSKYTSAGGKIQQKEDLSKIYGMDQEHVAKLSQHMTFPKKLQFNKRARLTSIYMNKATAFEFSRVTGIGPVLSERIVKFRDKLGGFHDYSQLNEVYGIEPEIVEANKDLFLIEIPPHKININTCDENQLGAHSYCSYRVAKAIINYRKQHGNFTKASDLKKIRIINDEWITKISPYLEY